MHTNRIYLLAVCLAASSVHATPTDTSAPETTVRELAPAQLSAIRAIGRNVLAAKKSAVDDSADTEALGRLRSTVNSLVAVELETDTSTAITREGAVPTPRPALARAAERRATARADARVLVERLRERGGILASRSQAGSASDSTTAGLPIAAQRAQLFERLSNKLDAALVETGQARSAHLLELRGQLDSGGGRLHEGRPLGTPTLQAMPSTSQTPIRAVGAFEPPPTKPDKPRPRKLKQTAQ